MIYFFLKSFVNVLNMDTVTVVGASVRPSVLMLGVGDPKSWPFSIGVKSSPL